MPTKNDRLQIVIDRIDAKADPGMLLLFTAASELLATIPLQKPSFSAPSGGTMTLRGTPIEALATGAGSANLARLADGDGVTVVDAMLVSLMGGGGEVIVSELAIEVNGTVTCVSGQITHA